MTRSRIKRDYFHFRRQMLESQFILVIAGIPAYLFSCLHPNYSCSFTAFSLSFQKLFFKFKRPSLMKALCSPLMKLIPSCWRSGGYRSLPGSFTSSIRLRCTVQEKETTSALLENVEPGRCLCSRQVM